MSSSSSLYGSEREICSVCSFTLLLEGLWGEVRWNDNYYFYCYSLKAFSRVAVIVKLVMHSLLDVLDDV